MPSFQVNSKWAVMSEIVAGLNICGVSALKPKTLSALEINLIVNCTKEVPNLNILADCERIKLWLEDTDETDLLEHFDAVSDHVRFVISAGGRVLIHCVAGVSRSAAFCLAYLMKYESLTLRQAYRLMAARRPVVRPNLGFWKQLIEYERIVRPDRPSTVRLVQIPDTKSNEIEREHFLLPDVYLQPTANKVRNDSIDNQEEKENDPILPVIPINIDELQKRRHSSGGLRTRFVPRLASVPEN